MKVEPRWLDAESAAAYISVDRNKFLREVKAGQLPRPVYPLGPRQPRWDRLALDSRFCGEAASGSPEQVMASVAQDILAGR